MLRYFCFMAVLLGVRSASAPFIKPCKAEDAACILASAQAAIPILANGIPELSVPSLDPMVLKLVTTDEAGLHLALKDNIVTGLKDCTADGVKLDLKKGKLVVVIRCSVVLRGTYKLSGQLLVFPVQGEGKNTITIRDIIIKASTEITNVPGADGQTHWHINKWRHTYQVKTSTSFDFDNLFNGNKLLADPVSAFVNSNWREVMEDIAQPIVKSIVERVVMAVDAFFAAVPADQLFIA
ncbi:hypothetical protein MSG28_009980 [Choristoneura fumiferana]|uniref:Uncharacterized protein n=2 Tax=Choristoneura fumiferana TaxID=7141 RepID=A0ACC0JD81_CHOFU|nr:hypothetical protein MSG28_009979 [Choristoneura fumiferana]KAI8422091.1 hypothetical protein MSG28_009980 [Choristoneura fumiferana]